MSMTDKLKEWPCILLINYNPWHSTRQSLGFKRVGKDAGRIFNFLQALTTGKISVTSMGGPLTIGNVAVSFAQENFGKFLAFLAFISVNLAIVNFLPIPVLDGGHAAFLIWEGVTGKPVNENTQFIASLAGYHAAETGKVQRLHEAFGPD